MRVIIERWGDIHEPQKRLIGGESFLTISGGLSVNFEDKERIEYEIYLSNRGIEGRPRVLWEGAGIGTGARKKEPLNFERSKI
jgi:hypothetical protein